MWPILGVGSMFILMTTLSWKIALPEMIEFLLEEWDDEGLLAIADYD